MSELVPARNKKLVISRYKRGLREPCRVKAKALHDSQPQAVRDWIEEHGLESMYVSYNGKLKDGVVTSQTLLFFKILGPKRT